MSFERWNRYVNETIEQIAQRKEHGTNTEGRTKKTRPKNRTDNKADRKRPK